MTDSPSQPMNELADWLLSEQARFAFSICCNDPAVKIHISTLVLWEKEVRSHAALKARIEELETALKPFVKFADRFGVTGRVDGWQITCNPSGNGNLTMGDCRNARAALKSGGAG